MSRATAMLVNLRVDVVDEYESEANRQYRVHVHRAKVWPDRPDRVLLRMHVVNRFVRHAQRLVRTTCNCKLCEVLIQVGSMHGLTVHE